MTGRKKHPRGKCGKILYFTLLDAQMALAWAKGKGRDETRVQRCNICWGTVYHLTSQPRRSKKKTGSSDPQSIDAESSRAIA